MLQLQNVHCRRITEIQIWLGPSRSSILTLSFWRCWNWDLAWFRGLTKLHNFWETESRIDFISAAVIPLYVNYKSSYGGWIHESLFLTRFYFGWLAYLLKGWYYFFVFQFFLSILGVVDNFSQWKNLD